ncbi:MAG: adenosylcobinamide-phosphate synthase CbiB [Candidatus Omnitrophota bacterium]
MGLIFAYILDLIFGDPEGFFHPIRVIGKLISFFDKHLRGKGSAWIEKTKGGLAALAVIGISAIGAYLFLKICAEVNFFLGGLAWIYLAYTVISAKDLKIKALDVYKALATDINKARLSLSKIVGRDTQDLDKKEVIKAAIESIAESANDGITAPLFYLILGGPILAVAYKAINTLDSMVGYKNKKYINFGWFAAKLDDVVNFIPARICGFLIVLSSFILGKDFKSSFKVMLRDGAKHTSPNSGIPEAAVAGGLGVRLGGPSYYQGKLFERPYIGEEKKEFNPNKIKEALNLSLMVSLLTVILGVILKWLI